MTTAATIEVIAKQEGGDPKTRDTIHRSIVSDRLFPQVVCGWHGALLTAHSFAMRARRLFPPAA
jgi:hypothetical protein